MSVGKVILVFLVISVCTIVPLASAQSGEPLLQIFLANPNPETNEFEASIGEEPDLIVNAIQDVKWLGHSDSQEQTVVTGIKIMLNPLDISRFAAFTSSHIGKYYLLQVRGTSNILLPIEEAVSDGAIWVNVPNAKRVLSPAFEILINSTRLE